MANRKHRKHGETMDEYLGTLETSGQIKSADEIVLDRYDLLCCIAELGCADFTDEKDEARRVECLEERYFSARDIALSWQTDDPDDLDNPRSLLIRMVKIMLRASRKRDLFTAARAMLALSELAPNAPFFIDLTRNEEG